MAISALLLAGAAYVAGAFTPSVGRRIKALFVKEATAVKAVVTADVAKKL